MGKVNINKVYKERIKQIDIDVNRLIHEKKWKEVAKFNAEKARIEKLIDESQ
jgi:hypothetical protein